MDWRCTNGMLGSRFIGEYNVLWMLLAVVQAEPVKAPPYYTAQERWKCTFPGFVGKTEVTEYFGIFRSHVESAWGSDYTLAQNDAAAVVFIASNYGETDMTGKTLHYASVGMIDKKSRRFKRTVLDIDSKPDERVGECQPY
jgi:hypothetical protein